MSGKQSREIRIKEEGSRERKGGKGLPRGVFGATRPSCERASSGPNVLTGHVTGLLGWKQETGEEV